MPLTEHLALHVLAITAEGGLRHVLRQDDGTWSPFMNVRDRAGGPTSVHDVACDWDDRAVPGPNGFDKPGLHVIAAGGDKVWHSLRTANGRWAAFGDLANPVGPLNGVRRVSCASLRAGADPWDDLHVLAVTSDGRVHHTIRHRDGSWQSPWGDLGGVAGEVGEVVDAAGIAFNPNTNWPKDLLVLVATSDGKLHFTFRAYDSGDWTPYAPVSPPPVDPPMGAVYRLGARYLTVNHREVHLCSLSTTGKLWHISTQDASWMSWNPPGDVGIAAGGPGEFTEVGVAALTSTDHEGHSGNWMHVLAVSTDGHLWHTIRNWDRSWQEFGDISAVTANSDAFASVAAAVAAGR